MRHDGLQLLKPIASELILLGYVRQKASGKLWVRERVEQLLDPGSFQEVGSVSGTVKWKQVGPIKEEPVEYVPSNNVQGRFVTLLNHDTDQRQGSDDSEVARLFSQLMTSRFVLVMPMVH